MLLQLLFPGLTPWISWVTGFLMMSALSIATRGSVEFSVIATATLVTFEPLKYRVVRVILSVMLFKQLRKWLFPGLTTEFGLFLTLAAVVMATGMGWVAVHPLGNGPVLRLLFHVVFPIIISHVEIRKVNLSPRLFFFLPTWSNMMMTSSCFYGGTTWTCWCLFFFLFFSFFLFYLESENFLKVLWKKGCRMTSLCCRIRMTS